VAAEAYEVRDFSGPFHRVGENPTLAMDRDLELVQWLDAWAMTRPGSASTIARVGDHFVPGIVHRCGSGPHPPHQARHGVVSLPYHHPFMVANRMVQTRPHDRGRVLFGVGRGRCPAMRT